MVIPLQGFSRNDCSVQDESEFRPRTVPIHCPVFVHLYSQKVTSVGLAACKTLLYKKRTFASYSLVNCNAISLLITFIHHYYSHFNSIANICLLVYFSTFDFKFYNSVSYSYTFKGSNI